MKGYWIMKKFLKKIVVFSLAVLCLTGCSFTHNNTKSPVTLTMWHVYGSQTQSPLNVMIDEFNNTVGKEHGIIINVVSITSSSQIDQALQAAANDQPGAENLPDLFTAYPRVAQIVGTDRLLEWDQYFSEDELSMFRPEFLSEGTFDGRLFMLPIAKSSEALYLNKTLFDRFSLDTGITSEQLNTFDGLFQTAKEYYDWSGGKHFMQLNDFYTYSLIGMKAYGEEFILDGEPHVSSAAFDTIWKPLAEAAIYGGICLDDGYAAARWKTVEIISNTGSTADVLYQPDTVVYEDNSSESITSLTLPYPAFTDNYLGVVHRGGGLFALKSTDEAKNRGAALFAKWITEQENNLNFVTSTGYLPVTTAAFDTLLESTETISNEKYSSLYEVVSVMLDTYELCALPVFDGASDIQLGFETNVKTVLRSARSQYLKRISNGEHPEAVMTELTGHALLELQNFYAD